VNYAEKQPIDHEKRLNSVVSKQCCFKTVLFQISVASNQCCWFGVSCCDLRSISIAQAPDRRQLHPGQMRVAARCKLKSMCAESGMGMHFAQIRAQFLPVERSECESSAPAFG
jgi:hypothetical protein